MDLEKEWVAAELKHDATKLQRILDDKFVFSYGSKKAADKATYIKEFTDGDIDPTESQTLIHNAYKIALKGASMRKQRSQRAASITAKRSG